MTKVELVSVAVLCLFMALTKNAGVLAAELVQRRAFAGNTDCQGDSTVTGNVGIANQCVKLPDLLTSVMYSCSNHKHFVSSTGCEGASVVDTSIFDCKVQEGGSTSVTHECVTAPDHLIARVEVGDFCTESGEMGFSTVFNEFFIINSCQHFASLTGIASLKLVPTDAGVDITLFADSGDCTGSSETLSIPIGICTWVPADTFGRAIFGRRLQAEEIEAGLLIVPGVNGVTLGQPGSPNPNSAITSSSATVFVLASAMIGAVAMLF